MKKLLAKTRAAADKYNMLGQNEKIAVGVSGGKDSMMLLRLMAALRNFHPSHFELTALCLDPCFGGNKRLGNDHDDPCVPHCRCR